MSIIFLHSYGIFTTLSPRTPTDHPLPPSTNNPDRPFDRYLPAPFRVPNLPTLRYFPLQGAEPCTSGCRTLQPRNSNDLPTRNTQPRSHATLFSTQLSSHRKLSSPRLLRPPILFTIRAVLPTFLPTSPLPKTPPPRCSTDFPRHQHCQTELKN